MCPRLAQAVICQTLNTQPPEDVHGCDSHLLLAARAQEST